MIGDDGSARQAKGQAGRRPDRRRIDPHRPDPPAREIPTPRRDRPARTRPGPLAWLRLRAASMGRTLPGAEPLLEREGDRLFLWVPVAFGSGIALYFALLREPSLIAIAVLVALLALAVRQFGLWSMGGRLVLAGLLIALGAMTATLRSEWVAAPVIHERLVGAQVRGRVVGIDPREDGDVRLRVQPVSIRHYDGDLDRQHLPRTLSLWSRGSWAVPALGATVSFRAVLMPPPDAAIPGGFDYARQAWFDGIGGVGFLISAPQAARGPPAGLLTWINLEIDAFRGRVAERIRQTLPGPTGAIAVALITGQRGAIQEADQEALRASGLAHILAISGLHMMLVVGTLFWATRALLALSPTLALTRPIKKWAAVTALVGGCGYLLLSGGSVATQRAFIMAAIMLVAVLLDRPAITLRNVAIAALVVLAMTPEALVGAGFQMSFAATIGLVAAYEAVRSARRGRGPLFRSGVLRFTVGAVAGLVFTALIAGLATGPFAAFHFNRVAVYGLIGNVAAMPLVSLVVMPAGLVAALTMPFGLEAPALAAMGLGIDSVLVVAHTVAGWEGAVRFVPQMPMAALLLIAFGGLWLALWRTAWRSLGVIGIAGGLILAHATSPPDVLIARDAGMLALRSQTGGLIFLPRAKSSYTADLWRRQVGSSGLNEEANAALARCDASACVAEVRAEAGAIRASYVLDPAAFGEDCGWADIVVSAMPVPDWCRAAAFVFSPDDAERTGAMALTRTPTGFDVETAVHRSGIRPWTRARSHPDGE